MIVPMKQVSIVGKKSELQDLIDTLKTTVSFEMSFAKQYKSELSEQDAEIYDKLKIKFTRTKNALNFIRKLQVDQKTWNKVSELSYGEIKSIKETEKATLQLISDLEKIIEEIKRIKNAVNKNEELIKELSFYKNLPIKFSALGKTNKTFIICGVMPIVSLKKFKTHAKLDKIVISEYPSISNKVCVVFTGHRENISATNSLKSYRFEQCKFDFDQTAKHRINELVLQNNNLQKEYDNISEGKQITPEEIQLLKNYHDYLSNEINTYDLIGNTARTQKYCVASGWIMAKDQERVTETITKLHPDVILQFADPGPKDKPPVVTLNNKIITPFQGVTNLYGAPSRGDLDPNPYVALFFFLFFGFMIGDAGYGLLLSVVLALMIWIKKPQANMKGMLLLFAFGGISAILWGLLFGSFFGISFYPPVFDPMHRSVEFMVLAMGLGVFQIMFGIALNGYKALLQGRKLDAALDSGVRIIMFIGFIMMIAGMFIDSLFAIKIPGMVIALGSLAVIFVTNGRKRKGLFGKIVGGFSGLYSLVGYFSDILSYVRLFALALVGAVVAMAGNEMGSMLFGIPYVGIPLGVIVAGFFHIFNLALGLLSAYVHGARLQFVEFFSKFYIGGNKVFQPTMARFKYTRLKDVK